MTLSALIKADVASVLMNTSDFAEKVTYRRGDVSIEGLSAVRASDDRVSGHDPDKTLSDDNAVWLMAVADIEGDFTEPARGDEIVVELTETVYRVLPVRGRRQFEVEAAGHMFRIRTKQIPE